METSRPQPAHDIALAKENLRLREEVAQLLLDVSDLKAMLRYLQGTRFAPSSERDMSNQPFLIPPVPGEQVSDDDDEDGEVKGHKRKKKRQGLPKGVATDVIQHDLAEDEKVCATHGIALEKTGEKILNQVEWIPAKIEIKEHHLPRYSCSICDCVVKETPPPPSPIPGSMATPSLLAQIACSKYADGLPLYRQEGILRRHGLELTRTTMATWMVRLGELVTPLFNLFSDTLVLGSVMYMDETHLQVLSVPGKRATTKSYLWVRVGGTDDQKVVLFDFGPGRHAEVALRLVKGFQGYIHTDGYDPAYDKVEAIPGIIRVQCWMHVRRTFKTALKTLGKAGKGGICAQAISRIKALYAIERETAALSPEQRCLVRQEKAKPLLDSFKVWLDEHAHLIPPKSVTGKAMAYALNRWPALLIYLDDGRLKMDNGPAENAIRPVAIGRKNWMFSDSVAGAHASAMIYSIIETAKANGLDPHAYLSRVIDRLPHAKTLADIEALLPWATPPPAPLAAVS